MLKLFKILENLHKHDVYMCHIMFHVSFMLFFQSQTNKTAYVKTLQERFNQNNLSRYLGAFLHRTDLSTVLADKLK